MMKMFNATKNKVVVENLLIADTFWTRLKGLLGTSSLRAGHGLLLTPCSSVHTIGMRYVIDVVFLDDSLRVLQLSRELKPGQFCRVKGSKLVLELPAGIIDLCGLQIGDELRLQSE